MVLYILGIVIKYWNRKRIIEWFVLEETFKVYLIQAPYHGRGHHSLYKVDQSPSNLILNTSSDGESTTSLDILFQILTTLILKNVFLTSNLNIPFSFKLLFLVLSPKALVKSLSPSFF